MGIDIRDGVQMECIGCALCIDACDEMMQRVGLPKGLIAFDSENNMARQSKGEKTRKYLFINKKNIITFVILIITYISFVLFISGQPTLSFTTEIRRAPLFTLMKNAEVRNKFTLKIQNRFASSRVISISIDGLNDARINLKGQHLEQNNFQIEMPKYSTSTIELFIFAKPTNNPLKDNENFKRFNFIVTDAQGNVNSDEIIHKSIFHFSSK